MTCKMKNIMIGTKMWVRKSPQENIWRGRTLFFSSSFILPFLSINLIFTHLICNWKHFSVLITTTGLMHGWGEARDGDLGFSNLFWITKESRNFISWVVQFASDSWYIKGTLVSARDTLSFIFDSKWSWESLENEKQCFEAREVLKH